MASDAVGKKLVENQAADDEDESQVGCPHDWLSKDKRDEEEREEGCEIAHLVNKGGVVGGAYGDTEAYERNTHLKCTDVHAGKESVHCD